MRAILMIILALMMMTAPALAKRCDGERPYYHYIDNGPGALLADLFLFLGTTPAAVAVAPLSPKALCVPVHTAKHFVNNRKQPKG